MSLSALNRPDLLRQQSFINGQWLGEPNAQSIDVINPATDTVISQVANAGVAETKQAIDAAAKAFTHWKKTSVKERARLLRRWHDLIMENEHDLALLLTLEQGKPLSEALGEIAYGASYIEWFAEESKRSYGDIIPSAATDKRIQVTREPVGVVATVTPWNFPNAMITRKLAPALAAGCTCVCKPAAETPLSALALCVLAEEAGIPKGVINVVVGSDAKSIGEELTSNPTVRKFSFTGSTGVGKLLQQQCSTTLKRTSLELGGNAPFIVFEDADLDSAVTGVMNSKFRNAGQTCVCTNRIIVHESVHGTFIKKLSSAVKQLKVGDGFSAATHIGPLISKQAVQRVHELVEDAMKKGATLHCGGNASKEGEYFYQPTLISNGHPSMRAFKEEIFGPLAVVYPFKTEQEAIRLANDVDVGLAAYAYTQNISRVFRLNEALEYGMVGINEGIISNEMAPFGGIKESGQGREGSKYGMDDYTELKYLCLGGLNQ